MFAHIVDLSVIVVSYNTRELTLACLRSVYEQTDGITFEVIVLDNASTDGSNEAIAQEFPKVKLLSEGQNHGFAGANNLAAKIAQGEYLLLLNPDTVVLEGALQKLLNFARAHPEAGICGGRTLHEERSLNRTSCWARPTLWSAFCRGLGLSAVLPDSRLFNQEEMPQWKRDSVREVDIVTGCLMMIRRELWEQLGGFDPAFFMYGEDADLCLRAKKLGRACLICPEATIIHYGGSSEKVRADKMVKLFRAKAHLYAKHWSKAGAILGVRALDLWVLTRTVGHGTISTIQPKQGESYAIWRTVWRRRREWHAMLHAVSDPKLSECTDA